MRFLRDLSPKEIKGRKVLVRVDFNVPISFDGKIEDQTRIKAGLPTIKYLLQSAAEKVFLLSHLGRPVIRPKEKMAKIMAGNQSLIMKPIAQALADWLKIKKPIQSICLEKIHFPAYEISENLFLLENIRFDAGEEKNEESLAMQLASLVDWPSGKTGFFVNDAFAACHRQHASVVGVTKLLPSYAGFLVEKEIKNLDKLLSEPERPFVLILGGAKVYDKMMVVKNLLKKVDFILLGGVMANTFMKARHIDIRNSVVENERVKLANQLFQKAARKFILPISLLWDKGRIVDVDIKTISLWKRYFERAKTIFWNGTMGLTSSGKYNFARGSQEIAKLMAGSKAVTIVSGGDTVAEVNKLGLVNEMTFVSTGGGATLQYLAGEKLPGLEALE